MDNFSVIQITQFRVGFELKQYVIQAVRCDFFGSEKRVCGALIGEYQCILLTPGIIIHVAGAFSTKHPGITHPRKVNQQAAEIVGRPGIDS